MKKVVLMACATLGLGASAMAEEMAVTRTLTVKYSRSEAATPVGAVKLYGTLQVCRVTRVPGCRRSAVGIRRLA